MLNIISILLGLVALLFGILGVIPFLGALVSWVVVLPIAVVGVVIGAISSHKAGRNLNLIVLALVVLRLFLGGGFI